MKFVRCRHYLLQAICVALLAIPATGLANEACEDLIPLYNLNRMTAQYHDLAQIITIDQFDYFTGPNGPIEQIVGLPFFLNNWLDQATEVLTMNSFDKPRQRLIRRLLQLQHKPKFANGWIKKLYDETLEQTGSTRKAWTAIQNRESGIETAAWIFTLSNGQTITAIHTSSHGHFVAPEHFGAAYSQALKKWGVGARQIIAVEYFHVHPRYPLSPSDIGDMHLFRSYFAQYGNLTARFHMTAILDMPGRPVMHHYAY